MKNKILLVFKQYFLLMQLDLELDSPKSDLHTSVFTM
jgi:hypothetical protein